MHEPRARRGVLWRPSRPPRHGLEAKAGDCWSAWWPGRCPWPWCCWCCPCCWCTAGCLPRPQPSRPPCSSPTSRCGRAGVGGLTEREGGRHVWLGGCLHNQVWTLIAALPSLPPPSCACGLQGLLALQAVGSIRGYLSWRAREQPVPPAPRILLNSQDPIPDTHQHTILGGKATPRTTTHVPLIGYIDGGLTPPPALRCLSNPTSHGHNRLAGTGRFCQAACAAPGGLAPVSSPGPARLLPAVACLEPGGAAVAGPGVRPHGRLRTAGRPLHTHVSRAAHTDSPGARLTLLAGVGVAVGA